FSRSAGAGELGAGGDGQVGLVHPPAGVGGAVPALQRDRADVVALLVVEHFKVRLGEAGAHLGRGAAEVDEAVPAVVGDGHGPPSLRFGLGVVKHNPTLLGLGVERTGGVR